MRPLSLCDTRKARAAAAQGVDVTNGISGGLLRDVHSGVGSDQG